MFGNSHISSLGVYGRWRTGGRLACPKGIHKLETSGTTFLYPWLAKSGKGGREKHGASAARGVGASGLSGFGSIRILRRHPWEWRC